MSYDAADRSSYTLAETEAVVGKHASVTLTGTIVGAGESDSGAFVKFELDECWGMPGFRLVMDLDPFEVEAE